MSRRPMYESQEEVEPSRPAGIPSSASFVESTTTVAGTVLDRWIWWVGPERVDAWISGGAR